MGIFDKTEKRELITDYGNGVIYFELVGRDFARELSKYLTDKNKRVIAVLQDNSESGEYPNGHVVIVERR
jgi:hypothetical protein